MRVVVLTGAGISAESGVPTFRDADGLWEGYRVEEVATPEAYDAQPHVVHRFYDLRRADLERVRPNPAHEALVRLEETLGDDFLLVTQNVDDLHERAGSRRVLHMHGQLLSALCTDCGGRSPWAGPLGHRPPCPQCAESALRPDIVWFGEVPHGLEEISSALHRADVFVSIGTSGAVYPAAGFVLIAHRYGARTVELNLEPSAGSDYFDDTFYGPAGQLVPDWVDAVLEHVRPRVSDLA
jgi:NAD-dependent deacetylase